MGPFHVVRSAAFTLFLRGLLFAVSVILCWATMDNQSRGAPAADTSADAKSRCESAAAKWFKEQVPEPEEHAKVGWGKASYTSHFSTAKRGCFMEVIETAHIQKNAATDAGDSEIHRLVDLKTGHQIGQLVIVLNRTAPFIVCELEQAKCVNADGWNALVGPYMRD